MERVPDLGRIAGVPAMPGFTAPKLLWLAAHEPEVGPHRRPVSCPRTTCAASPAGEHATDLSTPPGTLLLDQARRDWSPKLLAACGLAAQLPRLAEGSAPAGALRP